MVWVCSAGLSCIFCPSALSRTPPPTVFHPPTTSIMYNTLIEAEQGKQSPPTVSYIKGIVHVLALALSQKKVAPFFLAVIAKVVKILPHSKNKVLVVHVLPHQGVIKRCRLPLLTNSALVYESQCGGGVAGSQPMSTAVHIPRQ